MHKSLLVAAALAGAALAEDLGKAIVHNNCDYPVHVCNVPASGAGFQQIELDLQPGAYYSQEWTTIGDVQGGWSIKLTKNSSVKPVLQFEYTCMKDGIIWYDLSMVDGNPFGSQDWEFSSNDESICDPKQAAYQFWNDDANGMQASCPQSSTITLTLCTKTGSGGSGSSHSSPSPAPSPAPASQPAPAPVSYTVPAPEPAPAPAPAASSSTTTTTTTPAPPAPTYAAPAPAYPHKQEGTTTTTSAPARTHVVPTTVVEVETVYATAYVTVAANQKRHMHHPHHNHA